MAKLTKTARQHRIAKLLEDNVVTNQGQIVDLLAADGVEVNQATVSRDLEELSAVKVRMPGGDSAYAIPELPFDQITTDDHLRRVLGDWVAGIDRSGDLVVLRTPPGCAHVVASALDRSASADIIGTVAGDDTILVVSGEGLGATVEAQIAELAGLS
ncbi:MAG: arginine repressor [Actinobacteria bacterium]|nr:arginine repressor [Actinomycetota bacterium]